MRMCYLEEISAGVVAVLSHMTCLLDSHSVCGPAGQTILVLWGGVGRGGVGRGGEGWGGVGRGGEGRGGEGRVGEGRGGEGWGG